MAAEIMAAEFTAAEIIVTGILAWAEIGSLPLAQGIEGIFANPLVPLLLIGLFLWLLVIRPEKRRQGTHKQMLEGIKKNDRVVTIGGIRGNVLSVNREADEVVLKVDDNTKLRMTFGSIARIESDQAKVEAPSSKV